MYHFFSRRTYNAQLGRFTNNPAEITRYVSVKTHSSPVSKGHVVDRDKWLAAVKEESASNHVLVYVHGYNTDQSEFLGNLVRIQKGLAGAGWKGVVVGFDWPSNGRLGDYREDRTDAKKVCRALPIDGIGPLQNLVKKKRLHLLAHSMGAYLTVRGFSEVGDSGAAGTVPWGVSQLAFVASDIEQKWLDAGASGALVLEKRSARLTHYYSEEDDVLDIAGKIIHFGSKRSGRHGIRPAKPKSFHDVTCGQRYLEQTPKPKRKTRYSHNWYYHDAGFYKDLAATLGGADPLGLATRSSPDATGDQRLL